MPSIKRCHLLSDLERDRLLNRDSLDRHTRVTNDVRVRKKLSDWLKEVNEVSLVIDKLPKEIIQKTVDDNAAFTVMAVALDMIAVKNYRPIMGDIEHPEDWKVLAGKGLLGTNQEEPANDLDIIRSVELDILSTRLNQFLDAEKNPVVNTAHRMTTWENPSILEFLKENPDLCNLHIKAIERVCEAVIRMGALTKIIRRADIILDRFIDSIVKEPGHPLISCLKALQSKYEPK